MQKRYINIYQCEIFAIKAAEKQRKYVIFFIITSKNSPCYVMSEVLKRFYFALFDDGLTFKTLKLAYIGFCIQTLHLMMILFYFQEDMDFRKFNSAIN